MSARTLVLTIALLAPLLAGCTSDPDAVESSSHVTVTTSQGCFVIEFFPDEAPRTVENFLRYVDDRHYDGLVFHRIIPDFMIQGGGFTPSGTQKDTRDPIPLEAGLSNERGTVAMARTSQPNSATSQFFVNVEDNGAGTRYNLDPRPGSPGYAVFGKVVVGMDIVDKIRYVPTRTFNGMQDWPVEAQLIEKVRRGNDCTPTPPVYGIEVGLLHDTQGADGSWGVNVTASTDRAPFWYRGTGNRDDTYTVQIEGPARWDVTMSPANIKVGPAGTRGPPYGYAGAGTFTIQYLPEHGAARDDDRVTVTFTSDSSPGTGATLVLAPRLVDEDGPAVTRAGDTVTVQYRGTFEDGEEFDAGELPGVRVAAGGLVTGFAYGMLGLAVGETIDIFFPDELGYGHDNPPSSRYAQFNGEWLRFTITITERSG